MPNINLANANRTLLTLTVHTLLYHGSRMQCLVNYPPLLYRSHAVLFGFRCRYRFCESNLNINPQFFIIIGAFGMIPFHRYLQQNAIEVLPDGVFSNQKILKTLYVSKF